MTDHDHDHDHDHDRTVAPMVDEITDFEVLEIALRELCIEKGIFTAEEHRHFTEFAEQIGPTPAARLVARAWLDPEFKELALAEPMTASKEVGVDWLRTHRMGHAQRLHRVPDPRGHADGAQRDRLRAVLVLPAADPRQLAGVVPHTQLPPAPGPLAPAGARRVRALPARRNRRSRCRIPTRSTASW